MNTKSYSKNRSVCQLLFCVLGLLLNANAAEQKGPVAVAYREVEAVLPAANDLLAQGKWTDAVHMLTSVHPEAKRTVDQSQALASFLFQLAPHESYKLHKIVAEAHPDQELPNYMWAVEQHRRGEWQGAFESYQTASKLMDDYALTYGLAAECALRLGKVEEALKLWERSEKAGTGTLEEFETDVCRIHGPQPRHQEREILMKKTLSGDAKAAVNLIEIDLEWREDWWNGGANKRFLKADIKAAEKIQPGTDRELELALLAANLATQEFEDAKAKDLLKQAKLLDERPSIPDNGRVLSYLLTYIYDHEFVAKDDLRKQWGVVLREKASTSADAELHNAFAWLHLDQSELEAIDLQGWQKTGDARFAASYLGSLMQSHKLKFDSPELQKAKIQFRDNYVVQSLTLGLVERDSPRYRDALIATIKADYMHFPKAGMIPRPSAVPLRQVFQELAEISKPK